MQHRIPIEELSHEVGPQIQAMAEAIEACVHCGFCLPVCPTYQVLGEEMDSPRGRIILMKSALESSLSLAETTPYIDRCLGCLACVTACPSGVQYQELLTPFRSLARRKSSPKISRRLQNVLVEETLPYPDRFRLVARMGQFSRIASLRMPREFTGMLDLLPEILPQPKPLPTFYPAQGPRRARIAFLAGCVQQVLDPEINWATLRVLARNGVEIVLPAGQGCCGALLMHTGNLVEARNLASKNMRIFPQDVDAILTNAAGCGSGMKEYAQLFHGEPEQEAAQMFSKQVMDVSAFLAELGILPTPALVEPLKIAYHDACHLAHAQGVRQAPRDLLRSIPNLDLIEINESDMCCGSAGTYNLNQPEIAASLGRRKAENIQNTAPQAVVTGNIGCMVQIKTYLQQVGNPIPVYHTIQVLDMAYENA